jgi:argonaute-like protein implicated in RNA metabolism and viral defense
MAEGKTNVEVTNETWRRLTLRKEPGKTYNDIIRELLDIAEEHEDKDA